MTSRSEEAVPGIVERLRTGAAFHEAEGDIGLPHIMREAADHIERLTSALEPFAEQAEAWDPEQNGGCEFHDEDRISWDEQLTVGDLRRAREALSLIKKQGNGHG